MPLGVALIMRIFVHEHAAPSAEGQADSTSPHRSFKVQTMMHEKPPRLSADLGCEASEGVSDLAQASERMS